MHALEAFIGSLGILLFGMLSIPVVGHLFGVQISMEQGFYMGATFFVLRFAWLYLLRKLFHRWGKC